jgi:hypothetical protein
LFFLFFLQMSAPNANLLYTTVFNSVKTVLAPMEQERLALRAQVEAQETQLNTFASTLATKDEQLREVRKEVTSANARVQHHQLLKHQLEVRQQHLVAKSAELTAMESELVAARTELAAVRAELVTKEQHAAALTEARIAQHEFAVKERLTCMSAKLKTAEEQLVAAISHNTHQNSSHLQQLQHRDQMLQAATAALALKDEDIKAAREAKDAEIKAAVAVEVRSVTGNIHRAMEFVRNSSSGPASHRYREAANAAVDLFFTRTRLAREEPHDPSRYTFAKAALIQSRGLNCCMLTDDLAALSVVCQLVMSDFKPNDKIQDQVTEGAIEAFERARLSAAACVYVQHVELDPPAPAPAPAQAAPAQADPAQNLLALFEAAIEIEDQPVPSQVMRAEDFELPVPPPALEAPEVPEVPAGPVHERPAMSAPGAPKKAKFVKAMHKTEPTVKDEDSDSE